MSWEIPLELCLAVGTASVLGSLHCVGMCGPFALWASGAGQRVRPWELAGRLGLYHVGRLVTFLGGGLLVGLAGAAISAGGSVFGVPAAATRAAGIVMIVWGLARMARWARPRLRARPWLRARRVWREGDPVTSGRGGPSAAGTSPKGRPSVAGWLSGLRPLLNRMPSPLRALTAGSLTTLLPCGWLYLFLIVAAGTGAVTSSLAVMFAFWLGTLPALTGLVLGAFRFAPSIRPVLPLVGSVLLVFTGLYTATGRASADLSLLSDRAAQLRHDGVAADREGQAADRGLREIEILSREPLPCCDIGN